MKSKLLKRRDKLKKEIIKTQINNIESRSWRSFAYWVDEMVQNNTPYTDEFRESIGWWFRTDCYFLAKKNNPYGELPEFNTENHPQQCGEENIDMVSIDYF